MFELNPSSTMLLMIDMQEKFQSAIPAMKIEEECGKNCRILFSAAQELSVTTLVTEQYKKGLGETLPALLEGVEAEVLEKMHFSCMDDSEIKEWITQKDKREIIISGIETHVCVLGTAIDLINNGYKVVVVSDAVASRKEINKNHALETIRQAGGLVLPTESVLFRLLRKAGGDSFKKISKMIR